MSVALLGRGTVTSEYHGRLVQVKGEIGVPQFDPEVIQVMRSALEDAMTHVPAEYSTVEVKARLAEFILRTAAHGHTSYDALMSAATNQIHVIVSLFT
jgi:hypothetical protein